MPFASQVREAAQSRLEPRGEWSPLAASSQKIRGGLWNFAKRRQSAMCRSHVEHGSLSRN
jgi:hypothetical protein